MTNGGQATSHTDGGDQLCRRMMVRQAVRLVEMTVEAWLTSPPAAFAAMNIASLYVRLWFDYTLH